MGKLVLHYLAPHWCRRRAAAGERFQSRWDNEAAPERRPACPCSRGGSPNWCVRYDLLRAPSRQALKTPSGEAPRPRASRIACARAWSSCRIPSPSRAGVEELCAGVRVNTFGVSLSLPSSA